MEEKDLVQGTRVEYNPTHDIVLTGKICGIATMDVAIAGKSYIIELDEESRQLIPDYPYTHLVGFRVHLKEL